ncbi:hypothetical protein RWH45_07475 [Microbacterium sp. KSW4-17]|uniref:Uncharacterized protein n=1 Tax=Microbacterium galbum TaxID=3075994 RepID=A0ABU3T6Q2_9MICO|nr:hypothetical protein [Microbacterium sp. KSW4-17]MDU0367051.1 hypothetical protein [Microbacterium sp. KSW4-17]
MNRGNLAPVLGWALVVIGLFNLVLAVVDISSGASVGNNVLSAALGVILVIAGVLQLATKGRTRR